MGKYLAQIHRYNIQDNSIPQNCFYVYGVYRHFQQYFSHIVAVSLNGRKLPTCRKSLTNFITQCCMSTPRHERARTRNFYGDVHR